MALDLGTLVGRADFDVAPAVGRLRDLDQIVQRAAGTWEPALRQGGTRAGQSGGQAITDGVRRSGRDSENAVQDTARRWEGATRTGGEAAGRRGGQALAQGVEASADRARAAIDDTTSSWRAPAERGGADAGEAAGDSFADRVTDRIQGIKDKISGILSGDLGGTGMAAAGAAAGGLFITALWGALEQGNLNAKLTAQLGLTGAQSKVAGEAAGKLFAGGYGEGLEDIGEAVAAVVRNIDGMRDASSDALADIAGKASTLATIFGEDLTASTRAVSQMIRTGLVKDAGEAFDLLTTGMQNGANAAEDLSDTFIEYGTQFRKVGIDGTTAMGLLSQGMQAGARDADIVADAIKEFSIRAIDGSEATADGFDLIGVSADEMGAKVASGGTQARDGLQEVLTRLRDIEDPAVRSSAAVALFGTQAEDLGDALYTLDLDTAADGLGDVAGATDRANAAFNATPAAKLSSFWRSVKQEGVNGLAALVPLLNSAADGLAGFVSAAKTAGSGATSAWATVPQPLRDAAMAIGAVVVAQRLLGDRMAAVNARATAFGTAMRGAATAQNGLITTSAGTTMALGRVGSSIQQMGTHVPAIARMQTAFINAAAGADRFPRSAGAAAAAMSGLRTAGSGLVSVLGGPWGLALAAGGIALLAWQKRQQDAAKAAAESKARVDSLTGTIDKNTMSVTQATRATVAKTLFDKGVYEAARKYGLEISTVTDAIMGNKDALAQVNTALDDQNDAWRENAAAAANDGTNVKANDKANRDLKATINGLTGETKGAIQAARDQAAAMKTGADAAKDAAVKGTAYSKAMDDLRGKTAAAKNAQDNLTKAINDTSNAFLGGRASQRDYQAAIDAITDSIKENGRTLDTNTEKGRNNGATLDDLASKTLGLIKGYRDSGMSAEGLAQKMPGLRKQLVDSAIQMGMNAKAAQDYADGALGKIPDQISTTVTADIAAAKAAVTALGYDYDTLPKDVQSKITVRADGTTNAKEALASVGLEARNVPGQTSTVVSVPNAFASAALLSQLKNVAFEVDGKSVTVTSFAPQAAAVTQALQGIRGAQLTADGKSVIIPTGAPTAPMTRLLLENVTGAAYDADSRTVSVPTTAPGAVNATKEIDGVTSSAFRVPASRNTTVSATDLASGKLRGIKGNVDAIPSYKSITIDQFFQQYGSMSLTGQARADGGLTLPGGVRAMADGGILGRQAMIARAGTNILWAEDETGGESYIPLAASKRQRSMQILEATAAHFGARVVPMADGGTHATTTVAAGPDLARWERVAERIERAVAQVPPAIATGLDRRDARAAASILTKG